MSIKYFCDTCGNEISAPSEISARQIATIEVIDPATGKNTSQMCCTNCTPKLKEWIAGVQKENNVIVIGQSLNLNIKK